MQCERMRAMPMQSQILLLVTNHQIATCQGNAMDTGLRRYDGSVWLGTIFYEHCSNLCVVLFLSRHTDEGRYLLPRRDIFIPWCIHKIATQSDTSPPN